MKNKFKICVVGWSFSSSFYRFLSKKYPKITHIVAHRYNKILDELELNYSVTKNIGLEFGAYDWYIKNIWDKKSNVLFMHDDTIILKGDPIKDIFKKSLQYDYVYILSKNCRKRQFKSNRGFILSDKVIKNLLVDYDGFWYDKYNKGYIIRDRKLYDKRYTNEYKKECKDIDGKLKHVLLNLKNKYKLQSEIIKIDNIYFYRSTQREGKINNFLVDNSIFNSFLKNKLEKIAHKQKDNMRRDVNYYSKWYHYYFDSVRLNNFNIVEVGFVNKSSEIWKKYFKNSNIYNLEEVPTDEGIDIIIDKGEGKEYSRKKTFEILFKDMNNWGVYILENLHKNSFNNKEIIEYLSNKIYDINYNGKFEDANLEKNIDKSVLDMCEKELIGISFHPGICFVFKNF
jgi:hypothetical protein